MIMQSEKPTITQINTHSVPNLVKNDIISLCNDTFPEPFDTLFDYIPPDGFHILARNDTDRLVGHAVVTHRTMRINSGSLLRTAYIDAVATHPSVQKQGIGSSVMLAVIDAVQETHDLAALGTDIQSWYLRLGWELWRGDLTLVKDGKTISTPEHRGNVMIHRLKRTPAIDLDGTLSASWRPLGGW